MDETLVTCPYCGSTEDYEIRPAPDEGIPFCCYKALERVCFKCGKSFRYLVMKEDWGQWNDHDEPTVDPIEAEPNEYGIYGLPQCPVCHSSLNRGSRYCSWCGAKLSHPIGE